MFWFVSFNEIHIWKKLTIISLKDRRTGLDPDSSGADSDRTLSWGLTLLLTEESLHLKLSWLILVKVINSLRGGFEKSEHEKKIG